MCQRHRKTLESLLVAPKWACKNTEAIPRLKQLPPPCEIPEELLIKPIGMIIPAKSAEQFDHPSKESPALGSKLAGMWIHSTRSAMAVKIKGAERKPNGRVKSTKYCSSHFIPSIGRSEGWIPTFLYALATSNFASNVP